MKVGLTFGPKRTMIGAATALIIAASPAMSDWSFDGGEGSYYAYETDGGFINGTYQNGLMFFCPDGRGYCSFYVTLSGQTPAPRDVVTFAFSNGQTVQALAKSVGNAKVEVGYTDELLQLLTSQASVRVSLATGQSYDFSLSGSSSAIAKAFDP